MHEAAIIRQVIEIAEVEARRVGAEQITLIKLRIGEFRGVVATALEFAFDVLQRGSLAEGARLVVETTPLRMSCEECGEYDCSLSGLSLYCPGCGKQVDVVGGRDLEVEYVEVA
jgi:hydrogenase nickel incorporation protein HypA/HybF